MVMSPNLKQSIQSIVLSILLGFGSGVIATAYTTNYLSDYALTLGQLSTPARLSEERPRSAPQTYAQAVSDITESVLPSVAQFFSATSLVTPLSSGAVLTSDGWILTSFENLPSASALSVVVDGRLYDVEKMVTDPLTGFVFAKVNATNLPVFAFGSGLILSAGDQVFLTPSSHAMIPDSVLEVLWPSGAQSSDTPMRRLKISTPLDGYLGTPMVNIQGELVGVVTTNADILPTDIVLRGFNALLREGKLIRPSLGVVATDFSHTLGLEDEITQGFSSGVALVGSTSVKKSGAGALAGLKAGDIILSVDSIRIDSTHSLDELILSHNAGDTITLQVFSEGREKEVSVVLLSQ